MKDKIKHILEIQWMPAITTIIVMSTVFITCFGWMSSRMDRQGDRTDKLYEMFVDLLKDRR